MKLVFQQSIDRLQLEGAMVLNVTPGSGAAKSGLRPLQRNSSGQMTYGDLIVEINGEPIRSNNDLLLTLEKYKPGDKVSVKVMRDNKPSTVQVTLGSSL